MCYNVNLKLSIIFKLCHRPTSRSCVTLRADAPRAPQLSRWALSI